VKVVLVIADSLRADAPGYAGGQAETPFLDTLAREGAWFAETFASGAWTIPSILSMLTGALPHALGAARWRHPLPEGRPTLLTAFAAAGFDVRCFHPYPRWGFLNTPGAGEVRDSQEPELVVDALRNGGRDGLYVIHHWWTHLPYLDRRLPLDEWRRACDFAVDSLGRHPARIAPTLERSYREAVRRFSEEHLPRYVEAAASGGGDVLLVVTGDHGETWGRSLPPGRRVESIYDLHGRWIADETIRIPLALWGRGAAGAIPREPAIAGPARGADVGATIAELAGVPWRACDGDVGTSLAPALRAGIVEAREVVTMTSHNAYVPHSYPATGRETWRTFGSRTSGAWYVWDAADGTRQVSYLGDSDGEPDPSGIFDALETMRERARDPGPLLPDERGLTEARLEALGYLD
jgi:arylsulfatase A-like enzyme